MMSNNAVRYVNDEIYFNCTILIKKKTIQKMMLNRQYYDILHAMADSEINLMGDYIECYVSFILEYNNDDISYYIDRMNLKPNDIKDIFIKQSLSVVSDDDDDIYIIKQLVHDLFDTIPNANYFTLNGSFHDDFRIP